MISVSAESNGHFQRAIWRRGQLIDMKTDRTRRVLALILAVCFVGPATALAQYDPPAGYYATATGTGLTLKGQLHNIIDNHTIRSYDAARFALQLLDQDPNNSSRIILIYNGQSVVGTWDSGVTWNREHQWPRSLGVGESGPDNSDMIHIRPSNPGINGQRSNLPYGIGAGYWDPKSVAPAFINDRGDCSRAIFYMAVRYDGSDSATSDLEIVNGLPGTNQMGDLAKMLEWHYSDPVNEIERRRNHLIWSSVDNPVYFQGNRNPFIDRPEFVWTIFGTGPNDSTIYFGGSVPGDGGSAESVNFQVIVGAATAPANFMLNKVGSTPTTFDVSASGNAASASAGQGQAFIGGSQDLNIDVTLATTAVAGAVAGSITIDNTDLTSGGGGQGSADQNDVITLNGEILDQAEASFNGASDTDSFIIDFGPVPRSAGVETIAFAIHNLEATPGFTADLSIDSVGGSGDTSVLSTNLVAPAVLGAGSNLSLMASFDASVDAGVYEAIYVIQVSDEPLPGSQIGNALTLTLRAEATGVVPVSTAWGSWPFGALLLVMGIAGIALPRR